MWRSQESRQVLPSPAAGTDQEVNQGVEDSFTDSDELFARAESSIFINEASEEEIIVVNELKEIYD